MMDCRARSRERDENCVRGWWRDGQYQSAAARKGWAPGERATCEKEESTRASQCSFSGFWPEGRSFLGGGGMAEGGAGRNRCTGADAGWLAGRADRRGHTLKLPARGGRMRTGASAAGWARWACPGTWPVPPLAPRVPRVPNAPRAMVVGCPQRPRV